MKISAVIPVRMGSSRFPGKPLAKIMGISMVEHVYRRTSMCRLLSDVYVATCDEEIVDEVKKFGGKSIMTSPAHQRASDRVAEAARYFEADIVVMVQGDEPMTHPDMIEESLSPFFHAGMDFACVNLVAKIKTRVEFENRNTIKVVMDRDGFALFMSREPIPTQHLMPFDSLSCMKQVCIIPFDAQSLQDFASLPSAPLEQIESIDMLRFLENGHRVKLVETGFDSHAVDTISDLEYVEYQLINDPLTRSYIKNNYRALHK